MRNLKELKRELKKEYPQMWRRMTQMEENQELEIDNFLVVAIDDYKKYDQGSVSFTISAIRNAGFSYPEDLLMAIGGY
jgi:hypothetical protein